MNLEVLQMYLLSHCGSYVMSLSEFDYIIEYEFLVDE